jgi:quinol monooxygenase YgiN
MPEVVFVSTLEPKDERRDELVELLAELAKHIRGEPGYLQYSVHRPLGETRARSWSSRDTPRSRRTKSTARGRAARHPGLASSSQRLPSLPSCSNRSRSGTMRLN